MIDKEYVRELVRNELTRQVTGVEPEAEQNTPEQKSQEELEEGLLGRNIAKTARAVIGGTLGGGYAALGALAGALVFPMSAGLVAAAVGIGIVAGASILASGKNLPPLTTDVSDDLDHAIKARDAVLEKIAKDGDATKYANDLVKLTEKQKKLGLILEKAAKKDMKDGRISRHDLEAYMKLIDQVKDGKLSYLAK